MEDMRSIETPDVLDMDLTGFTTSYPVLRRDNYPMRIVEMKVAAGKDHTKGGKNLEFVLETINPAIDTDGKPIAPGHKVTDRFSLTPTDKYPKDKIGGRLRSVYEAAFGVVPPGQNFSFGDTANYIGRSVVVRLDVEVDDSGKYDPKNKVGKWIPREA